MKFVDKEIQEDFDNIPEESKFRFQLDWLRMIEKSNYKRPRVLMVREWLERKRKQQSLFNDALKGINPKPTYGIQFEIINGKVVSNMVKIDKD